MSNDWRERAREGNDMNTELVNKAMEFADAMVLAAVRTSYMPGRFEEARNDLRAFLAAAAPSASLEFAASYVGMKLVLTELVACKDLKNAVEALHFIGPNGELGQGWEAEYDRMRAEYIRRQPAAWDAARKALAAAPGAAIGAFHDRSIPKLSARFTRAVASKQDMLPCPFCGNPAEMDTRQGYTYAHHGQPRHGTAVAVYCPECSAQISVCREDVPDIAPEAVIEMWNRRAFQAARASPSLAIQACQAAIAYDAAIAACCNDPDKMASYCTAQGDTLDTLYDDWIAKARAALRAHLALAQEKKE